ncbi:MAG: diaminopimelate decarboxylase [Burkholderiaceae bacterium]|nr:diaminopimelate decarboxylase [Burkholderiaceae bacterium]
MDWLESRDGILHAEGVALPDIAERFGTPTYVYSRSAIVERWGAFAEATAGRRALVCYALKANSNLAIIDLLARAGAGFDIVSGGELRRVLAAGASPERVVFSGVGKSTAEIELALRVGVRCFNVESESELKWISATAVRNGASAAVSLRVNPDVDARTHPYISTGLRENKFGVAYDQALELYQLAVSLPAIEVVGIDCHIGSQITEIEPFVAALDRLIALVEALEARGIALRHIDLGGGLGIRYDDERPPTPRAMLDAIFARIDASPAVRGLEVLFEFGRAIVGNAGLLLTRVEYLKSNGERRFAIVDAAMNDLMRPALYDAYHRIVEVQPRDTPRQVYDVVGPICESGDWLGRARSLALAEGDLLAILSAGAYAMAMSSNYNTRPRAAEVIVDRETTHLVREREPVESLYALERRLSE